MMIFKHLTQKLGSENFKLLKQKDAYPNEYMDSFERFSGKKFPDKKYSYRSLKDGTTNDTVEILNGHITDEEYLTRVKTRNRFNMKNIVDYHDHYLEEDVLLPADIFEKFNSESLNFYKLDPSHYFISLN